MAEVLQPLEIGHGHAARIQVHIRYDEDAFLYEDLIRLRRQRTVGCFPDDAAFIIRCILPIDHALQCRRDQDIGFQLIQRVVRS